MQTRLSRWAFALALALVATTGGLWARDLTFEDRVKAQEAIERVYWSHRIWPTENPQPKPPLSAVMSDEAIRAKVEDYLRKSNALEQFWHRPLTTDQLQTELERMARGTKRPDVLRELFSALGNDPFLIAECMARPALADRLIRDWYSRDDRFHLEIKTRAESALSRHGLIDTASIKKMGGQYIETTWRLGSEPIAPAWQVNPSEHTVMLNQEEWETTLQVFNATLDAGDIIGPSREDARQLKGSRSSLQMSGLQEDSEGLHATIVLAQSDTFIRTATVTWRKVPFDRWWAASSNFVSMDIEIKTGSYTAIALPLDSCADDSWTPTMQGVPDPRKGHTAVWTGSEMIVWGGSDSSTGGRYDPTTDLWTATGRGANVPAARAGHTAVWTGREMIIWGGGSWLNSGGRYDPSTDTWSLTSVAANVPAGRIKHTAVWTGSEMIVWGGNSGNLFLSSGGRYNPLTNTWTRTGTGSNLPSARQGHTAVWTSKEMVVWGGTGNSLYLSSGGRYNPLTNTWLPTSTVGGVPEGRFLHTAVWTGDEMIVWGGYNGTVLLATGGRYSPSNNTWVETGAGLDVPQPRYGHTSVWTGSRMIIWGGRAVLDEAPVLNTGGLYNPTSDTWTPTSVEPDVAGARSDHTAVWTGSEMIVWGGAPRVWTETNTGARYDPLTDRWIPTGVGGGLPSPRRHHTSVWTGSEMIIWGGEGAFGGLNTGSRYDPATDIWISMSIGPNVPSARYSPTVLWTGREMIVWGGDDDTDPLGTGGRYDPSTDTWLATSGGAGVPTKRSGHTAVWTGREMIVWGGWDGVAFCSTGGKYDPIMDAWVKMSVGENVPSARARHAAVWTGREMVVWAGTDGVDYLNTGGRYSPESDSWTPTSMDMNVPSPRESPATVWTGTEMIIWGGWYYSNTGGRYDPTTDAWIPTGGGANLPSARNGHTAVWTGSEMIVWGGYKLEYPSGQTSSGGRYNPTTDGWMPTAMGETVPESRYHHTAVWTGTKMIVWGGLPWNSSGGLYCANSSCAARTWYAEADGDGYGLDSVSVQSCSRPSGYSEVGGDCNDGNPNIHPGAPEVCDGLDDNCDGTIDENGAALCDDGDHCTDDLCGGVTGCVHVNNTAPCSDGNACTLGDACSAGICSPGRAVNPKLDCDDHNACTRDYCDEGPGCMNAPIICRDGNPSTLDSCDPRRGCVFTPRHGRQVTAGAHGQVEAEGD